MPEFYSNVQLVNPITQTYQFLIGLNYNFCKSLLEQYAEHHQANAALHFKNKICSEQDFRTIINLVAPYEYEAYMAEYPKWLKNIQAEDNLLSFLEFLAYKKHHRIKTFLKLAHLSNPKPSYWPLFTGAATLTAATAGYFAAHPNHFDRILDWIVNQAPALTILLMDYVFLPINVPRISLLLKFFTFAYTLRLILNNHVTDDAHKIKMIFKAFIENALIFIAQFLCFLNGGILYPAISMLFIASSLFSTLWSFEAFFNLEKPKTQLSEPHQFLPFYELSEAEFQAISSHLNPELKIATNYRDTILDYRDLQTLRGKLKADAFLPILVKFQHAEQKAKFDLKMKQLEENNYYQRKREQFLVDFLSLCVLSAGSVIVILALMPLPYLNIFFIVFQYFVNRAKTTYFENKLEPNAASQMQQDVDQEWQQLQTKQLTKTAVNAISIFKRHQISNHDSDADIDEPDTPISTVQGHSNL